MPSQLVATALAKLEPLLSSQIDKAGQLAVTEANTGIPGLTDLLNRTVGPNLVVSGAKLALADSSLQLSGAVALFGAPFLVKLTVTQSGSGLALHFNAAQAPDTSIDLMAVLARVIPEAKKAPQVRIGDLQVTFDTSDKSFLFSASSVPLAVTIAQQASTIASSLTISSTGGGAGVAAALNGSLVLGSAAFTVALTLGKGTNTLVGTWATSGAPLGWSALLHATGLDGSLSLPPHLGDGGFTSAKLTADLDSRSVTLVGLTASGGAYLSAAQANGQWGVVIGVAVGANWTLSQLSGALAPLDVIQFQQAYLVASSAALPGYSFPDFAPMTSPVDLVPGLNLGAVANFEGHSPLSQAVAKVLGKSTLNVQGSIGTPQNTRISASLGGTLHLPACKGVTIGSPELIILPTGPTVELQGTLVVPLGKQEVDCVGRLAISPERAVFTVDVSGGPGGRSLPAPFGFTGVTLQDIGVSLGIGIATPGVDLAMAADFVINGAHGASSKARCAIEFTVLPDAVDPVLLWAQFDSLSLPLVLSAFVPSVTVPDALGSVDLKGVTVFYCQSPTLLPDNTPVSPGFALHGTLDAFSFTMAAALDIHFGAGIAGSAAMSPIRLAHDAVTVTGKGNLGGPTVAFNTQGPTYFAVSLDVKILDLAGANVNAVIGKDGFSFALKLQARSADGADSFEADLQCRFVNAQNFSASAELAFALDLHAGPIKPPGTSLDLGTIHIKAQFHGQLQLAVTPTTVSGSVSGTFDGRSLPSVSFTAPTAELKAIPQLVVAQIKDKLLDVYKDVLGDVRKWSNLVSSGVISGVSDVGGALTGFYHQSSEEAEKLMRQLKLHGSVSLHVDQAGLHADTTSPHLDVPAVHVDTRTPHLDGPHIDTSGPHIDSKFFGHHGDTGGSHVDSKPNTGGDHIDRTTTPHGDTRPHVDTRSPHVDARTHVDL